MKHIALILALCCPSCALRVYDNGKPAIADYTDFEGETYYKSRTLTYWRKGRQDAATPTRVFVDGVGNVIVKGALGAGVGIAVP